MKVDDLEGALLDYWVARAERWTVTMPPAVEFYSQEKGWRAYSPSTNWAQGGPIIEREKIGIFADGTGSLWGAEMRAQHDHWIDTTVYDADSNGPTPLIAAMRAYVANKFGNEVEISSQEKPHG